MVRSAFMRLPMEPDRPEKTQEPLKPAPPAATSSSLGATLQVEDFHVDEDPKTMVPRLEQLQKQQRSPQQPNAELDRTLIRAMSQRPELRARMAVMAKSPDLRKKILSIVPEDGRILGSAQLGNSHSWRLKQLDNTIGDQNWPKATTNPGGLHHLPGFGAKFDALLRSPTDKIPYNPALSHTENYSFPRAIRFGDPDAKMPVSKLTPGPGAYFKSVPRGTAFSIDGGETVTLGANHVFPWKKVLGRQINPIEADLATLVSEPCYSFPKVRRTVSDTVAGHNLQTGGAVKSDCGPLSPGPIYQHFSSMRPRSGKSLGMRTRSTPAMQRIRCVPAPLEAEEADES